MERILKNISDDLEMFNNVASFGNNDNDSVIETLMRKSSIGVVKVTLSNGEIGYCSEEDYYADVLEDGEFDFVAYDSSEFFDIFSGMDEDVYISNIEPFNPSFIENGIYRIFSLNNNRSLIVRSDLSRLIVMYSNEPKIGDLIKFADAHKEDFSYPNDDCMGVLKYSNID